jgi:hypothetical protein
MLIRASFSSAVISSARNQSAIASERETDDGYGFITGDGNKKPAEAGLVLCGVTFAAHLGMIEVFYFHPIFRGNSLQQAPRDLIG